MDRGVQNSDLASRKLLLGEKVTKVQKECESRRSVCGRRDERSGKNDLRDQIDRGVPRKTKSIERVQGKR
jgi:hypothetical protein